MNSSNLALRLEEFEARYDQRAESHPAAQMSIIANRGTERRAPRLSLTTRRVQLRDPGLRRFRVF